MRAGWIQGATLSRNPADAGAGAPGSGIVVADSEEEPMHGRRTQSPVRTALAAALAVLLPAAAPAQSGDAPRTPWGDPDLGGVWDYWTFTPLERPEEFAERATLTA